VRAGRNGAGERNTHLLAERALDLRQRILGRPAFFLGDAAVDEALVGRALGAQVRLELLRRALEELAADAADRAPHRGDALEVREVAAVGER